MLIPNFPAQNQDMQAKFQAAEGVRLLPTLLHTYTLLLLRAVNERDPILKETKLSLAARALGEIASLRTTAREFNLLHDSPNSYSLSFDRRVV